MHQKWGIMKILLMLVLVLATTSGALAQPWPPSIAIYFGGEDLPDFDPYFWGYPPNSATTTPAGTFWAHVVVIVLEAYDTLAGYEVGVLVPEEDDDFFPMSIWSPVGGGLIAYGTYPGLPGSLCMAQGYVVPRPIGANGCLSVLKKRFCNFYGYGYGEWWLGPWGVMTIAPKIVVDGIEMYVSVHVPDYAGGWVVCAGPSEGTAVAARTWTEVKALFD